MDGVTFSFCINDCSVTVFVSHDYDVWLFAFDCIILITFAGKDMRIVVFGFRPRTKQVSHPGCGSLCI